MSRIRSREVYEDDISDEDYEEEELEAGPSMGEVLRGEVESDAMVDELADMMEQARIADRPIVQPRSRVRQTLATEQLSDLEYLRRIRTMLPSFTLQDIYEGLLRNSRVQQELADTTAGKIYTTMKLNNLHRSLFMEPVEPGVISVHIDQLKRDGRNISLDDVASAFDAAPELEYELEGIYMYLYFENSEIVERFLLNLTRLRDIDLVPLTAAQMQYGDGADFYLPHSISIRNLNQTRIRDPSYSESSDLSYLQGIRSMIPSFELSNVYARLQRVQMMRDSLKDTPVGRFYSYLRDAGIHLNVDAEVTSDNRVRVGTVYDRGFDGILDSERVDLAARYAGIPIDRERKLTISGGDDASCQFVLDLEKLRDIDIAPMSAARMNFDLSDIFDGNYCDFLYDGTVMSLLFFE